MVFKVDFHGSRWVFMVFHDSRLVFHGSRTVFVVFHGFRMVFHCFRLVSWFFMVPGRFSWIFMGQVGFSWFFAKMYLPELYPGPMIQSRSAARRAA